MISLQTVSKRYGSTEAVSGIDWRVEAGEWWGVIGPNGSGKSTLLKLLSGAERPSEGRAELAGKEISRFSRKELARTVAVLQQEGLAMTDFTVREVLEMGRFPFQNWMGREIRDPSPLIDSIIQQLDLKSLEQRRFDELSGGQRQRVALGKVMAQEPSLLLLDEPTTFLDIRYQIQFMDMVSEWRKKSGITVVSVLHDLNLAAQFCDRLLVLKDGHIAGEGRAEDLLTEGFLQSVFQVQAAVVAHPDNGAPQVLLTAGEQK